jgi:hypothetical protein
MFGSDGAETNGGAVRWKDKGYIWVDRLQATMGFEAIEMVTTAGESGEEARRE